MKRTVAAAGEAFARSGIICKSEVWRRRALCRGQDPEMWYPVDAGGVEAVAICAVCTVRLDCLTWALENNERDGIWGGISARRRQRMRAEARLNGHLVGVSLHLQPLSGSETSR
jgi:WhiB family redox-sensing transcriptional regulator